VLALHYTESWRTLHVHITGQPALEPTPHTQPHPGPAPGPAAEGSPGEKGDSIQLQRIVYAIAGLWGLDTVLGLWTLECSQELRAPSRSSRASLQW